MSPPPKKKNKVDAAQPDSTEIPVLPDDLLLMIFGELTTEEREPLGTTCKRFRELDFELGNKTFDFVDIDYIFTEMGIIARTPNTECQIQESISDLIHPTYRSMRMFRNAKAKNLCIKHHYLMSVCYVTNSLSNIQLLEKISYEKLRLSLGCRQDCNDRFIRSLVTSRNLKRAVVSLNLLAHVGMSQSDRERMRELMMQLPQIDKFKLEWNNNNAKDQIINDRSLLHIVLNTNHSVLCRSDCTDRGISDVFEIVRASQKYKYVKFFAHENSAMSFFSNFTHGIEIEIRSSTRRFAYDIINHSVLRTAPSNDVYYWAIEVGKITAERMLIRKNIDWP